MSQAPIMPDQFRVNLPGKKLENEVAFYQLTYKGANIDLRGLRALTAHKLPATVNITPPNLSRFDHTVVLIGITGKVDDPELYIWLAGNYNYRNVTLFLDYNQDRDFTNDNRPVKMKAGGGAREITMRVDGEPRTLNLKVPKVEVKRIEKYKVKIANRFGVSFSGGVGSGRISYEYKDLDTGYPTWYFVKITEKNLSGAFTYDLRNATFGVSASFQSHYYFTSHLNVRKGDPFTITIQNRQVIKDNIERNKNTDIHSPNRFQYGFFAAYKIPISRSIDLQPIARWGRTSYTKPEYNRLRNSRGQLYRLDNGSFYELGIRSEFTIGIERAVYIEVARNKNEWRPIGFLDDTPHTNFNSESVFWKVNIGYRFTL